jgi:hypothetical protein
VHRFLVPAVLLCLLAALPTAAQAKRSVPKGWLGTMVDGPMTVPGAAVDGDWRLMSKSGVESVRSAVYWPFVQPTEGATPDFSRFDPVVLNAARRGLPVLPVVEGTPGWASVRPGDEASPPRDPELLAQFMRDLIARYGRGGSLWAEHPEVPARPVRAWQIGNEPNLSYYFNPPEGESYAVAYTRLLKAASRAIRAADPGATVVLAGLTNRSWIALRAIYKAGGRKAFDAVALHPYTAKPRNVLRVLKLARREMKRVGDRRKPLWVTELSWPSSRGKTRDIGGIATTERGQATKLRQSIRLLAAARKRLRIQKVYWYTWMSTEGDFSFLYSGLRRVRDGKVITTPALSAFRSAADRLYGR